MKPSENQSAYLTLRGLLIWQYGRDLIAAMVAQAEFERHRSGPLKVDRSSTGDGWRYAEELNTRNCTRPALYSAPSTRTNDAET